MRCLVTGYGFVSRHLVEGLLEKGADVTVIEKNFVPDGSLGGRATLINQDLRDLRISLAFDYVFHLAAVANPGYAERNPIDAFESNVMATLNLLNCVKVSRLFMFSSSSNVYGNAGGSLSESSPLQPINTYGVTKLAAEELIKLYTRSKTRTPHVIFRFFTLYGPGSAPMYIVPQVCIQALRDGNIAIRNGAVKRDFLFVGDAVDLMMKVALSGRVNDVVNVGSGVETSIGDVAKEVGEIVSGGSMLISDQHSVDPMSPETQTADISRALSFGWTPKVALGEGLRRTVDYYRKALALNL